MGRGIRKSVFLCEGWHEQLFLEILLKNKGKTICSERWDFLRESGVKKAEGVCIKDFLGSNKGYNGQFLLKDEDGKDRCMETFIELFSVFPLYHLYMILDSQGTSVLEDFRIRINYKISKDILNKRDEFWFSTKNPSGHHVIFNPMSLEKLMQRIIGHSPDYKGKDQKIGYITDFLSICQVEGDDIHHRWYRSLLTAIHEQD
jgi:hypothetical protein